jgi:hypothetical protein
MARRDVLRTAGVGAAALALSGCARGALGKSAIALDEDTLLRVLGPERQRILSLATARPARTIHSRGACSS